MTKSALLLLLACTRTASALRPAKAVVKELLPLLREGGTTRAKGKSPSTVAKIDAFLDELAADGAGKNFLDSEALYGNYEVQYFDRSVDGGRDGGDDVVASSPGLGRKLTKALFFLPLLVLRKSIRSEATYQHVTRPKTLVNFVRFRLFGLLPAAVIAKATFERLPQAAIDAIIKEHGAPLTSETAHVEFDRPRVAFGRRGLVNFEVSGPSAQPPIDLSTTYVDDEVRCGVAARGGKFVFTRGGKASLASADDWRSLLERPPCDVRTFLGLSALGLAAAVAAPYRTVFAAPVALWVTTRATIAIASADFRLARFP
mmetsp:Transcript_24480/g.73458  ORF Transcript_24480/g.73458 Transcript_24480/m.73458 type:complete len:315 (+) Transcript_24480:151-1095(+)